MSFNEAEKAVHKWLPENPSVKLKNTHRIRRRFCFERTTSTGISQQFYLQFPTSSNGALGIVTEDGSDDFLKEAKELCASKANLSIEDLLGFITSSELSSALPSAEESSGSPSDESSSDFPSFEEMGVEVDECLQKLSKFRLLLADNMKRCFYFQMTKSDGSFKQFYINIPTSDKPVWSVATVEENDDFLKRAKRLCSSKTDLSIERLLCCIGCCSSTLRQPIVPEEHDVRFNIMTSDGDNTVILFNKRLLIARSDVFKAMFKSGMSECQGAISDVFIDDIDADTFQQFLEFISDGTLPTDPNSARFLIYTANKYMVSDLIVHCANLIQSHLDTDNVISFLEVAIQFDCVVLRNLCLQFVSTNSQKVLNGPYILFTDKEVIRLILQLDNLSVKETLRYNVLIKWAKCLFEEGEDGPTDQEIRQQIGDLIYLIHLPGMSLQNFAKISAGGNILTNEEKELILNYIVNKAVDPRLKWPLGPRDTGERCVQRAGKTCEAYYWLKPVDAFHFVCDSDVILTGIGLYAGLMQNGYTAKVDIMHLNDSLCSETHFIPMSSDAIPLKVVFNKPVPLSAGKLYTVEVIASDIIGFSAQWCHEIVTVADVHFTFYSHTGSQTTTHLRGQIPQLFFSLA